MDAEASHPDALVADGLQTDSRIAGSSTRNDCATGDQTTRRTHAVNFQVRDVKTHVEVLGHVPLGARANPPAGPVVVAARIGNCEDANVAVARALQRAKDGIGLAVIAHRGIAAVERRPPARVPEVLVARVEAPRRGQINVGVCVVEDGTSTRRSIKDGTAIDAVSDDAVARIKAALYPPVVVRRVLEYVAQRSLRVDALQLQVVARADKWRVQPQASHRCPAPFVVGVTTAFRGSDTITIGIAGALLVEVIGRIDLMQGARDCRGTPSLIDAQIGDDVRDLPAAVALACALSSRRYQH
jgi:hypothetical protein